MNQLESLLNSRNSVSAPAATEHQKISIRSEGDIVVARGAGRQMCKTLGFTSLLQVKLATAISELARNIVQYAGEGSITLHASHENGRPYLQVTAEDHGPGIPNLDSILSGRYVSKSGMGKGLTGTRNMVDEFDIRSSPNSGTLVVIRKWVK
ncbi:MAG: anti-sigma regulatory factor [Deltaproteobacteria bacterium]|nr:anti-sigma regulatory factor [Deltaproteobacteria bacterium]